MAGIGVLDHGIIDLDFWSAWPRRFYNIRAYNLAKEVEDQNLEHEASNDDNNNNNNNNNNTNVSTNTSTTNSNTSTTDAFNTTNTTNSTPTPTDANETEKNDEMILNAADFLEIVTNDTQQSGKVNISITLLHTTVL